MTEGKNTESALSQESESRQTTEGKSHYWTYECCPYSVYFLIGNRDAVLQGP